MWSLRTLSKQNKCRTDAELTLAKAQLLSADSRSQERFQRIRNPFYLLYFTVFHLSKVKDLSIIRTNLQWREKEWHSLGIDAFLILPSPQKADTFPCGVRGSWSCSVKSSFPSTHHTVHAADRPCLRFQLPAEELAEVSVVVQIFNSRLLHVHAERPDVQAVNGLPQPRGQLHLVQATPGSREQASRYRFVQSNLKAEKWQHAVQFCPLMAFILLLPITEKGWNSSCQLLPWIQGVTPHRVAFKSGKHQHCTSSSLHSDESRWGTGWNLIQSYTEVRISARLQAEAPHSSYWKLPQCEAYRINKTFHIYY